MPRDMRKALQFALKLPIFALNALWAIPAVLLVRMSRPWVHVRMGYLDPSRIGHFVADAALYLASRSVQPRGVRFVDLFYFQSHTCNAQWARMARRQLFVRWWVRYLIFFNRLIPAGDKHDLPFTHGSRDIHGVLQRSRARFEFTSGEEQTAKAWLRRRAWQDGEPFVCLLVRDSAYLSSHPLHRAVDAGDRWSYHDYRDSDIEIFVEASQALVDRGYWVIRMGKVAHKRLAMNHPRVIDYPFVEDQDDLFDIWLSANCLFFVSTGTGIDQVSIAYGRPVTFVNLLPCSDAPSFARSTFAPKHLRWRDTGLQLTLQEILQHGYHHGTQYEQAGIAITDLSPSEITSVVMESEQRLAGIWIETEEDRDRQLLFWKALRAWPDFPRYHGYIHPEARAGAEWLKSMGNGFFAD